jgi:hypothetical protein
MKRGFATHVSSQCPVLVRMRALRKDMVYDAKKAKHGKDAQSIIIAGNTKLCT